MRSAGGVLFFAERDLSRLGEAGYQRAIDAMATYAYMSRDVEEKSFLTGLKADVRVQRCVEAHTRDAELFLMEQGWSPQPPQPDEIVDAVFEDDVAVDPLAPVAEQEAKLAPKFSFGWMFSGGASSAASAAKKEEEMFNDEYSGNDGNAGVLGGEALRKFDDVRWSVEGQRLVARFYSHATGKPLQISVHRYEVLAIAHDVNPASAFDGSALDQALCPDLSGWVRTDGTGVPSYQPVVEDIVPGGMSHVGLTVLAARRFMEEFRAGGAEDDPRALRKVQLIELERQVERDDVDYEEARRRQQKLERRAARKRPQVIGVRRGAPSVSLHDAEKTYYGKPDESIEAKVEKARASGKMDRLGGLIKVIMAGHMLVAQRSFWNPDEFVLTLDAKVGTDALREAQSYVESKNTTLAAFLREGASISEELIDFSIFGGGLDEETFRDNAERVAKLLEEGQPYIDKVLQVNVN